MCIRAHVYVCLCVLFFGLCVCLFIGLSVCQFVGLSVCRFACMSACLHVCLSACLLVRLSVHLSVCMFVCLSISESIFTHISWSVLFGFPGISFRKQCLQHTSHLAAHHIPIGLKYSVTTRAYNICSPPLADDTVGTSSQDLESPFQSAGKSPFPAPTP